MKKPAGINLILTGGGTGGHVYPSIAIYKIIKKNFNVKKVSYLGCKGKAEEKIVPGYNIPMKFISSSPISGVSKKKIPVSVFKILRGFFESFFFMLRFKPDVVLASGGYVSAPVILAAFFLKPIFKLKIVLDEQNVFPGLLNRFGSLFADVVFLSFKESAKFIWNNRCIYSGYPVREEFLEKGDEIEIRKSLGIPPEKFVLLISGGSMGARNINRLISDVIPELIEYDDLLIIHSCGMSEYPYNGFLETVRRLRELGFKPEISENDRIKEGILRNSNGEIFYIFKNFIYDISSYMKASDVIVSRAGAGSLTEICALGKPSIIIPKRDLPGFHQELNAISLAEKGGCEVIFEKKNLDGRSFLEKSEFLYAFKKMFRNYDRLKRMGFIAFKEFNRDFESVFVKNISYLLEGRELDYINQLFTSSEVSFEGEIEKITKFLRGVKKDSYYIKFFNNKVDEYLKSDVWHVFNKGVKLVGALKREDKIKFLLEKFPYKNGFIRRNILNSVIEVGIFLPELDSVVKVALNDSYFEVRRNGVRLLRKFHRFFKEKDEYVKKILEMLGRKREHFEVKCEILRTLPYYVDEMEYYHHISNFLTIENVSYREAVLDGLIMGFENGLLVDRRKVYKVVNGMLITTSYFKPEYGIRNKYLKLFTFLEKSKSND